MKKKHIALIAAILSALLLLFPMKFQYRDGRTVEYRPITSTYSVKNYHELMTENAIKTGTEIRILGFTVYQFIKWVSEY